MQGGLDGGHVVYGEHQLVVYLLELGGRVVVLHKAQHRPEGVRLEVFGTGVAEEVAGEGVLLEQDFLEVELGGGQAQRNGLHQFQRLLGHRAEDVGDLFAEGLELVQVADGLQLFVEAHPLADAADVVGGEEGLDVGLEEALAAENAGVVGHLHLLVVGILHLLDGLGEDFLVHFVADLVDETALVGAEDVARAADVEVAQGNLDAAADVGEILDGLQPLAGLVVEHIEGLGEEVAVGLLVVASHTPAQLVEHVEREVLGVVDDHCVGVHDVKARLDDGGGDQHIGLVVDEVGHYALQLGALHLAVADGDARLRHEPLDEAGQFLDVLNLVVHDEHLSAPVELALHGLAQNLLVEDVHFRLDGLAVGGWGGDDGDVARPHQRELQGARNGRGRHRQRVHTDAQLAELLLGRHAELLLLVDDQEPEVLEMHVLAQQPVRADEDVNAPFLEALQDFTDLFGGLETVHIFDRAGHLAQTVREGGVVLQRQHGGGHEHGHLLVVADSLEGGADGDFRLAESHVAADEAVHWVLALHIALHVGERFHLIGGVLVNERGLQLGLHKVVGGEGEALAGLALRVKLDEVDGQLLDTLLGALLELVPRAGADAVQGGGRALFAHILADFVERVDAHIEDGAVLVHQSDGLLHLAVHLCLDQPFVDADAVVDVHHIVAGLQVVDLLQREGLALLVAVADDHTLVLLEELVVGVERPLPFLVAEPFVQDA